MGRSLALLLLLTTAAHADTIDHDRKNVIIADAIADGIGLSAAIPKLPENLISLLFWGGIFGQAFTAPVLHAANQDYGRAGIDLGVRIAAPVAGFFVGDFVCERVTKKKHDAEFLRCLGGAFLGSLIGIVGAQVVDWTLISRPSDKEPIGGTVMRFGFAF